MIHCSKIVDDALTEEVQLDADAAAVVASIVKMNVCSYQVLLHCVQIEFGAINF